ncbi:MAG TPA: hypothetical protein VGG53_20825 [Mycobacterium sp.]|jgi:hypothetical protein|uniref:hypothetical protein n=1 Tax=Mycobacterium sp. TaxID=1785 RepID=UPI002F3F4BCC
MASNVRRWAVGVGAAGGAAVAAAMLGATAAHADDTSPLDLLSDAQVALTEANQVLGQIDPSSLSGQPLIAQFIDTSTDIHDHALQMLDKLDSAETTILSFDNGALSNLISPLFTNLDQQWDQTGEAVLAADQTLAGAVAGGSVPDMIAAQFGALIPDGQLLGPTYDSIPVVWIAALLGGGDDLTANVVPAIVTTSPLELLNDAATNLTDANQVLSLVPSDIPGIMEQPDIQNIALDEIASLDTAQSSLSSFDNGALTDLLNPWFNAVDQGWDQGTEALLNADQALETAVTAGSGVDAAVLGVFGADFQVLGDIVNSLPIEFASGFIPTDVVDPSVFTDFLTSFGL